MMTARKLEAAEAVRCATTEAQHVAMQTIPKANATTGRETASEFKRQGPVAGARNVLAELRLVRREDANAASPARNGHIPLLGVCRRLDSRVGEQDVINRLTLRAVGRNSVSGEELAKA